MDFPDYNLIEFPEIFDPEKVFLERQILDNKYSDDNYLELKISHLNMTSTFTY